jgi:hypothetical protein
LKDPVNMKHGQMLERLVDNALDFLDRSLHDFDAAPKFSVIHFYAAVELFLKARLLAEHWSLVVTKRQDPDIKRFLNGDFQSVSLEEAADKLDKVLLSPLAPSELAQFRNLAKHRNRMVHFFHEASTGHDVDILKQQIAMEQLKAWYLLNRLLMDRWDNIFGKWKSQLDKVTAGLNRHHEYLQIVYEHKLPEIAARIKKGDIIDECLSCGFKAAKVKKIFGELKKIDCLVCQFSGELLLVDCPDCDHSVAFINDGFSKCVECGRKIEPNELAKLMSKDKIGTKDYFESGLPASCAECESIETVIEFKDEYLCTGCFNIYKSEDLHQCEWCQTLNAGNIPDSFWKGCVVCEGRAGHERGKDD